MSRCVEFYTKWEKDPNWCEKCPSAVRQINSYMELVDEMERRGISRERTIVQLSETAARPIFSIQDENIKEKVISSVQKSLEFKKDTSNGKFKSRLQNLDVKHIISSVKKEEVKPSKMPEGFYDVILADPPWQYDIPPVMNRDVENQYSTMNVDDIKSLTIPIAKDAIIFLWVPPSQLQYGLDVLSGWGFKYKTHFVWDKEIIGIGYWVRNQHELLLIGIKGDIKAPLPENRFSSVIRDRRTKHSQKPDTVYDMIERMYPNGKFLELFARKKFNERWAVWGNEV